MSQRLWAKVGQVAAGVAAVATIFLAVREMRRPTPQVVFQGTVGDLNLPPTIREFIERSNRVLSPYALRWLVDAADEDSTNAMILADRVSKAISDSIGRISADYGRVVTGQVRNMGRTTATSVVLSIPHATLAYVSRSGAQHRTLDVDGTIDIGDVRPREILTVSVWTDPFYVLDADEFTLTHDAGIGRIQMSRTVTGFWAWLAGIGPLIPVMLFSLIFVLALVTTPIGVMYLLGWRPVRQAAVVQPASADEDASPDPTVRKNGA